MFEMIYAFRKKCYDVIGAVEKQSAVADKTPATEADICFSCTINEKTFDEGNIECESTGFRV